MLPAISDLITMGMSLEVRFCRPGLVRTLVLTLLQTAASQQCAGCISILRHMCERPSPKGCKDACFLRLAERGFLESHWMWQLQLHSPGAPPTRLRQLLLVRLPQKMTDIILEGIGLDDGFQQDSNPTFGPCEKSYLQNRMRRAVAALGEAEVEDILAKEGHVEVTCNFCADTYRFDEAEIKGFDAAVL